ncbi:hypothetical protein BKA62DRAFT_693383 [Auriculariales sp. MPI-PUGE-AT-0066]|nr:hypothetical protein BKA62DRAFT_693383 [Auriculariales sp. MPI-PUGE-AT-0066]
MTTTARQGTFPASSGRAIGDEANFRKPPGGWTALPRRATTIRNKAKASIPAPAAPVVKLDSLSRSYVSLRLVGDNVIQLDHLAAGTTHPNAIAEQICAMIAGFWPAGVETSTRNSQRDFLRVQMNGSPWSTSGLDASRAMRLVNRVFQILAQYHLSYACSAKPSSPLSPLAHAFCLDATILPGTQIHFVGVSISAQRQKITLVDLPSRVLTEIATIAESYFSGFTVNNRVPTPAGATPQVNAPPGLDITPCDQGLLVIRRNAASSIARTTCDELLETIHGILARAGFILLETVHIGRALALKRRQLQLYRCIGPLAPEYA